MTSIRSTGDPAHETAQLSPPDYANRAVIRYYFQNIAMLAHELVPASGEVARYEAGKIFVSPVFGYMVEDAPFELDVTIERAGAERVLRYRVPPAR